MSSTAAAFQNDLVVKTILGFLPFEHQAGYLRLVNRGFKKAAGTVLKEIFFDEVKGVIGYDNYYGSGWFKAEIRRGPWTTDFCTSQGSCIDDALSWLVSCHCGSFDGKCAFNSGNALDKDKCMEESRSRSNRNWDMDQARTWLRSQGWFRINNRVPNGNGSRPPRPYDSQVQVRFEQGSGLTLGDFCRKVHRAIQHEVSYELMPRTFQRFYGLEGEMTCKRFLRSLFVLFGKPTALATGSAEGTLSESERPTIGMAKTVLDCKGTRYVRMQMNFRFYTSTTNEPVEICLRAKHDVEYIELVRVDTTRLGQEMFSSTYTHTHTQ